MTVPKNDISPGAVGLIDAPQFLFPEWGGAPPHSGKKKFEKVHEMVCGKGRIKGSCDSSMIVVFSCEKAACNLTY